MTREAAVGIAREEAVRFGLPMAVYRLPAWPVDVYGVRVTTKLPSEALQFERFEGVPLAPTEPAPAIGQGSLF